MDDFFIVVATLQYDPRLYDYTGGEHLRSDSRIIIMPAVGSHESIVEMLREMEFKIKDEVFREKSP